MRLFPILTLAVALSAPALALAATPMDPHGGNPASMRHASCACTTTSAASKEASKETKSQAPASFDWAEYFQTHM